ncbi:hypothetical protein ACGF5F_32570 [Streptomyces sp. NPDC047821]|uniref:hypothetical protein n=1 Tax=Streptomyces sp. NPDC047821 TaxID=3365488 RepID=UPI0037226984
MSTIEKVNGHAPDTSHAESWARAGIADAEAEAIRARTAAEIEERRIKAEAEAEAIRLTAREEAEKLRLANERAALRFEREKAEQLAKIAEAEAKRQEVERQVAAAEAAEAAERTAAKEQQTKREQSADSWRTAALSFAVVCAIVALPVQMSAFWSPAAPWLLAAPLVLEGGAWVVLKGAAAAVDDHRPHWHYRTIAWALAVIAAGINFAHGIDAFDLATAIGTAFASLAGPGVWDLHEHGRIRKRDGKLTWRQRREQRAAEAKAAKLAAREEERKQEERRAAEEAAAEAAQKLAETRSTEFPKVWAHAVKLAAALGETTVTEAIWRRAHKDIEGVEPGDSVDIIRTRNTAERRVLAARSEAPGSSPVKVTSSQIVPQVPARGKRGRAGGPPVRGVRRAGDVKYSAGARRQQSITARAATTEEQS